MNEEMKRIMEALMLIYGSDLQAATITVLLKDGDTAFRFLSSTFPQVEPPIIPKRNKEKENEKIKSACDTPIAA